MMATEKVLSDLEKAAYRSRWRDGTLDLCGGLGVLAAGWAWHSGLFWATGFAVPVLLVLWVQMRKRIVEPRSGRVTFGLGRREKEKGAMTASLWFGVGLLLFIVALSAFQMRGGKTAGVWVQDWISALPVALLGLMALQTALMTGVTRFVWYAALLLVTGILGVTLKMEPGAQILVAGTVITAAGAFLLFRFISESRPPAEEEVG